jgi:beta-1,2-mannobiose phosphorylase / 1,2-beta-oligomannan phosphorylase
VTSELGSERWVKYAGNPVLGGSLGTCFDMSVDVSGDRHRMWFSWRPKNGIGYAESRDGLNWVANEDLVLDQGPWLEVTRPYVLVEEDGLTMWYSAKDEERVVICWATSADGLDWQPRGVAIAPEELWEKSAVMCPSVLRYPDGTYHMWYSGGERYEPDAIGYAVSEDGIHWRRMDGPVLRPDPESSWESERVAGAHVFEKDGYLYAAYIGFADGFEESSIGIARSRDGIDWQRHAGNPVITHGDPGDFDSINVYKPFVVIDGDRWRMWFNASAPISGTDRDLDNRIEQIGYASCRFQFRPLNSPGAGVGNKQVGGEVVHE